MIPLNAVSVGLTEKWLLSKVSKEGPGEPREAWRKAFRQSKHPGSEGSTLGHSDGLAGGTGARAGDPMAGWVRKPEKCL